MIDAKIKINRELLNRLKKIKSGTVEVGWHKDLRYDNGMPVHEVAKINEFGATIKVTDKMRGWFLANGFPLKKTTQEIYIPERSFIRATIDEKKDVWSDLINNCLKKVFSGELSFEQALLTLGLKIKDDIQIKISEIAADGGNSTMTIAMKGKDTPLINTGIMQESISVETEVK